MNYHFTRICTEGEISEWSYIWWLSSSCQSWPLVSLCRRSRIRLDDVSFPMRGGRSAQSCCSWRNESSVSHGCYSSAGAAVSQLVSLRHRKYLPNPIQPKPNQSSSWIICNYFLLLVLLRCNYYFLSMLCALNALFHQVKSLSRLKRNHTIKPL